MRHELIDPEDIEALADNWRLPGTDETAPESHSEPGRSVLPDIRVGNRQLRELSEEALEALRKVNDPPRLFTRGGFMVSLMTDDKGQTIIAAMTEPRLRGWLARSANYYRLTRQGDRVETFPPPEVVKDVLALDPALWRFLPLDMVIEVPALRPDGTILNTPGYDAATRLYYAPAPTLILPPVSDHPNSAEAASGRRVIESVIAEFPFVDQASRTNAIALILTPFLRSAIYGSVPLALIDATAAGTGKTLLADVSARIATGKPGDMLSAPKEPDEWRKQITTALIDGNPVVIFDNLSSRLDSAELCKAITEEAHGDRAMKTHERLSLPVRCVWIATGNNIQLGSDMPRRCYRIRMDPETSKPFLRDGFIHPDLKGWVAAQRGEIIGAILTLARAWYAAGQPRPKVKPVGSFENWTVILGGILEFAGIEDFLRNADEVFEQADIESIEWEGFIETLDEVFYSEPFITADITQKLTETQWDDYTRRNHLSPAADRLRAALPGFLGEVIDKPALLGRRIGRCFAEREGRRFGEEQWHIRRTGQVSHHAQCWKTFNRHTAVKIVKPG